LLPFVYDSTNAAYGPNALAVHLTDTDTSVTQMQTGSVQVLKRANLALYYAAGGGVVQLSPVPIAPAAQEPSVEPLAFGATGGGESFPAAAPGVIGDPPPATPADEVDLDSITPNGASQITITLAPFTDLPPDDPSAAVPWNINVDTTTPGLYSTDFELNYSDEQDIGGADAPGSEHGYFQVVASVAPIAGGQDEVQIWLVVPEPAALALIVIPALFLPRRRKSSLSNRRATTGTDRSSSSNAMKKDIMSHFS
jgi:hypothetical protein